MLDVKNKKLDNFNIVFDIRNSSIGAAIFKINDNTPKIIFTNRKYTLFRENQKTEEFITKMKSLMLELVIDIQKFIANNEIKKINRVNCIFSSPWYQAKVETLIFNEKKQIVFTKDYLNKKIKNMDAVEEPKGSELLEDKILSTYLNGYEVINPYKKTFKQAKFAFYKTFIGKNTKIKFEEVIKNSLNIKNVFMSSHPIAILTILKTNYHSIDDFCLFDIGGEITEISIFEDGLFKELINIPKGFNYLIRKISEKEKTDQQATISKIKLISNGEIVDEELEKFILDSIKDWFSEIKNLRKDEVENMSKNIFITTDNEYKKILSDNFNKKDFYNKILELSIQPNIRIIDTLNTKNLATYKENVARDPMLSILCNFSTIVF